MTCITTFSACLHRLTYIFVIDTDLKYISGTNFNF